jgi:hypothetical protein
VDRQIQLDPVAAQRGAKRLAQRCGVVGEQVRGALDEGDLAAQPAHGLGHLDAHRAATEDEQAARHRGHRRDVAVGPHIRELAQAGNGRHDRVRPGGQDHVPGGVLHTVDLDHTRAGEGACAAQQVDALALQPALRTGVRVVGHHEVPPGQRGLHVDLRSRSDLTCPLHGLARTQQRLGRDAGPVRALAAHQLPLHHRDPQAAVGQLTGAVLTGGTCADDDDVVVVVAHAPTVVSVVE